MRSRRRARGRAALFLLICTVFSIAVVLLAPSSRRAAAQNAKKGAKPTPVAASASAADAGASAEGRSDAAAPKGGADKGGADKGGAEKAPKKDKPADDGNPLKGLPRGKGLPVHVNVAIFFLDVKTFDDNKGEFEATTDVRLSWYDSRHEFPADEAFRGYKEWRGKAADDEIEELWMPSIEVTNRVEAPSYTGRRLRIYPEGKIEVMTRTTAKHKVKVDPERFPFDRQFLRLELLAREHTRDEVVFGYDRHDIEFSRVDAKAELDGWSFAHVDLSRQIVAGWNGDRYSGVTASLPVDRDATGAFTSIFIPLMASLLIPLLATWMNRATEDGFEIEAFELANMGIGGLFSVIALSFAIYSSFGLIAGTDNTVTRLFGLNYASIGVTLAIVVLLFQYNVMHKLFGTYVHREFFRFICWALPLVSLGLSVAFIMAAAA